MHAVLLYGESPDELHHLPAGDEGISLALLVKGWDSCYGWG